MTEVKQDQKETITINDKDYIVDNLTPVQRNTIGLVLSTDNKIMSLQGEIAILQAGRDTMLRTLTEDLENPQTEDEEIKQLNG